MILVKVAKKEKRKKDPESTQRASLGFPFF